VAVEPIDFRAGIDGLANNCRKLLQADPFSGTLFVFRNRARTENQILTLEPGHLGEPQTGLHRHQYEGVIAPAGPATLMARDGEVGEIATVHSDFDVLDGTVPDGYWRAGSLAR
jgi:hypothetical protein